MIHMQEFLTEYLPLHDMSSCENFVSSAALAEICSLQVRLVYFVKWQPWLTGKCAGLLSNASVFMCTPEPLIARDCDVLELGFEAPVTLPVTYGKLR